MNKPIILIILILLLVTSIVFIIVLAIQNKNKNQNQNKNMKSFSGLPKQFLYKNDPSILDISRLSQSSNYQVRDGKSRDYIISEKPIYLSNGLKIHIDIPLLKVLNKDIEKNINIITDNKIIPLEDLIDKFKKIQDKSKKDDLKKYKDSTTHYVELITNFLASNPNADQNWKSSIKLLGDVKQILDYDGGNWDEMKKHIIDIKNQAVKLTVPNMDDIYNYLKFTITKLGGISAILHRFQHRIKWDMIQSIANGDPRYRTPPSNLTEKKGSGECTFYPLSWWQNCPNDTMPVGSRGYGDDKSGNACNKWYQHLSGELLCAKYDTNTQRPIKGPCLKIINALKFLKDDNIQDIISFSITTILSTLSLIPQLAATIKTITVIFKLALPFVEGDYTWLIDDLKDVCFNYMCEGNNTDKNYVCNNKTDTYCIPKYSDNDLSNRDCHSDKSECNTEPSGCCSSDPKKCVTTKSKLFTISETPPIVLKDYSLFI